MKKIIKIKKKIDLKKNTPKKERESMVLLEDLDSKFDLLIEGHMELSSRIDKNHSELSKEFQEFKIETGDNFKSLTKELRDFKVETGDNFKSLTKELRDFKVETKDNFKGVFGFFSNLDDELKDIHKEIDEIKELLSKNEKVDPTRILIIERRLGIIEASLAKSK